MNKKLLAAIVSGSMLAAPPLAVEAEKVNSSKKSSNATSKVKKIVIGAGIVGTSIAGAVLVARELIQGQSPVSAWLQKEGKSFVQTLKTLLSKPVLNQLPENPEVVAQVLKELDDLIQKLREAPVEDDLIQKLREAPVEDDLIQKLREVPVEKVEQLQKAIQTLMEGTKSDENLERLKGILQILQMQKKLEPYVPQLPQLPQLSQLPQLQLPQKVVKLPALDLVTEESTTESTKEIEIYRSKLPQLPQPQKEVEPVMLEQSKEEKENQAETENAIAGVQSATEESRETIARMGKNMEEKSTTEPTKEIEIYRSRLPQLPQPQKEVNPPASDLVTNDKIKQKFSQLLGSLQQITKEEKEKHQAEMGNAIAGMENATENLEKAIAGMEEEEKKEQTNWEKALGKVREELQVQVCDSTKNLPTEESTTESTTGSIMKKVEFDLIDDPNDIINAIIQPIESKKEIAEKVREAEKNEISKIEKDFKLVEKRMLDLRNSLNSLFKKNIEYVSKPNSLLDLMSQLKTLDDFPMRNEIIGNYIAYPLTLILEQASDEEWKSVLELLREINERVQEKARPVLLKQLKKSPQELALELKKFHDPTKKYLSLLSGHLRLIHSHASLIIAIIGNNKFSESGNADVLTKIEAYYRHMEDDLLSAKVEARGLIRVIAAENVQALEDKLIQEREDVQRVEETEQLLEEKLNQAKKDVQILKVGTTEEKDVLDQTKTSVLKLGNETGQEKRVENVQVIENELVEIENVKSKLGNTLYLMRNLDNMKTDIISEKEKAQKLMLTIARENISSLKKDIEDIKNLQIQEIEEQQKQRKRLDQEQQEQRKQQYQQNVKRLEEILNQAENDLQILENGATEEKDVINQAETRVLKLGSKIGTYIQIANVKYMQYIKERIAKATSLKSKIEAELRNMQGLKESAQVIIQRLNQIRRPEKLDQKQGSVKLDQEQSSAELDQTPKPVDILIDLAKENDKKTKDDAQKLKKELEEAKEYVKVRRNALSLKLALELANKQETRKDADILTNVVALILGNIDADERTQIIEKVSEYIPNEEVQIEKLNRIHAEMLDFEQERNLAAEFYRQKRNIPEENTMAVMQAEMQIFAQKLMLAHARVRTLALLRSSNKKLEQKRIESLQRVQSEINALKQELEMELKYVSEQVQEYVRDQVREPINAIEYELAQLLGSQEELKQATTSTALIVKHSLSLMQRLNEKLTKNSKKQQLEKRLAAVEQKLKQALNLMPPLTVKQILEEAQKEAQNLEKLLAEILSEAAKDEKKSFEKRNGYVFLLQAQDLEKQLAAEIKQALEKESNQGQRSNQEQKSTEELNQGQETTEELSTERMLKIKLAIAQKKESEQELKNDLNSSLARILTQIHVLERECKLKEAIKNLLDKTRKGIKGKIQDEAIDQVITQQKEQKITLSNLKYSQCQAQELTQNVIDGQSQNKNQVQKTDIVQLVEEISKAKSQEDIRGILKKVRQGCNLSNVCELIDNLKKEIEQKKLAVQKLKQKENSNTAEESTRKYLPNQYQFHTAYCKLDQKVTKENLSRESFVAGTVVDAIQQEIKKLETQKSMDTLAQLRIITLYGDLQRAKAQEREINRLEAWATNGMSKKQTRLLDDIIQRHDSLQYDTLIYN